jgi:hypothetical protein
MCNNIFNLTIQMVGSDLLKVRQDSTSDKTEESLRLRVFLLSLRGCTRRRDLNYSSYSEIQGRAAYPYK